MLFLAGFFNRSSLTFLTVTVVRIFSIVAILLGVAAEIFLLVDGIQGVKSAVPASSTTTPASSSGPPTSNGNSTLPAASTRDAVRATQTELCGYIGGTDVPKSFGGVLFFSLAQFFNIVVLVLCLLSELSPPRIPDFFEWCMPPLGQGFGVGFIGALELFIGCSVLSHNVKIFPSVAGWWLFVLGWLNILLGIVFGPRIRAKRSITQAGKSYVKNVTHYDDVEKGVKLGRKGFELGKKGFEAAKKKKGANGGNVGKGGAGYNISRPMMGGPTVPAPPTYDGQPIRTFDGPWERTSPRAPSAPSIAPSDTTHTRTFEGPREVRFGGQEEIRDGPVV